MSYRLGAPVHTDHLIKKSRFIGCVQTVRDRAEAVAVVDALRLAHPGAAHVCWALMAGGQSAANDDGEPSGTAGRPMLEVLRHQDLGGAGHGRSVFWWREVGSWRLGPGLHRRHRAGLRGCGKNPTHRYQHRNLASKLRTRGCGAPTRAG